MKATLDYSHDKITLAHVRGLCQTNNRPHTLVLLFHRNHRSIYPPSGPSLFLYLISQISSNLTINLCAGMKREAGEADFHERATENNLGMNGPSPSWIVQLP